MAAVEKKQRRPRDSYDAIDDALADVIGAGSFRPVRSTKPEPTADERLQAAAAEIESRRVESESPRVYFRSPRGGQVPLDARGRRELLQLYSGFGISVNDIAEHFHVGSGTIYRWLMLLGVQSQDRATPAELSRMAEARALARKSRKR